MQQGAVFTQPTLLKNALVGEAGTEVLAPESMLRNLLQEVLGKSGGRAIYVTQYFNEVLDPRDPNWKRELKNEMSRMMMDAVNAGS